MRAWRHLPLAQLAAVAAATALGGLVFGRVFSFWDAAPSILAAAILPVLVAGALRLRGRPHAVRSVGFTALAWLVFVSIVVLRDVSLGGLVPTPDTLRGVMAGLTDGWARILSTMVPVPGEGELLVFPVALTWAAGFAAAETTFRTRSRFGPLAPGLLLAIVGFLFGLDAPGRSPLDAALFLVAAGTYLALRRQAAEAGRLPPDAVDVSESAPSPRQPRSAAGLAVAAGVLVLVLAVAAPLLGGALPFLDASEPLQLRDHWETAEEQRSDLNPLALVAAGSTEEAKNTVAFTVTVDEVPPTTARFRLAVLDTFDGADWTSSATYETAGDELPVEVFPHGKATPVTQTITIEDLAGPWLPVLAQPESIEIPSDESPDVQLDEAADSLAVTEPDVPVGFTYTAVSQVADVDPSILPSLGVASDLAAGDPSVRTVDLPPSLARVNEEIAGSGGDSFQLLARLLAYFQNDPRVNSSAPFAVDPEATPGHTLAHLDLFVSQSEGSRRGNSEQFAAAFAVLARASGFPTRIAVGFQPDTPLTAGETREIHLSELRAWPEVALDGIGWYAIDPVPSETDSAQLELPEQELDAEVDKAVEESVTDSSQQPTEDERRPGLPESEESSRARTWILAGTAIVVALLVLIAGPIATKALIRARRRRKGSAADRVAAAWQESLDRMDEAGLKMPGQGGVLTTREVAERSGAAFGEVVKGKVGPLGSLVNAAAHDRTPPSETDAARAWTTADDLRRLLAGSLPFGRRLRAAVDPRPLVHPPARRHVGPRAGPTRHPEERTELVAHVDRRST